MKKWLMGSVVCVGMIWGGVGVGDCTEPGGWNIDPNTGIGKCSTDGSQCITNARTTIIFQGAAAVKISCQNSASNNNPMTNCAQCYPSANSCQGIINNTKEFSVSNGTCTLGTVNSSGLSCNCTKGTTLSQSSFGNSNPDILTISNVSLVCSGGNAWEWVSYNNHSYSCNCDSNPNLGSC